MDSYTRFGETSLPSKEHFFSNLNNEDISDEDYHHAETVFQKFNCKNLGDYHDLYLTTDVLLLADVFESFRDNCIKHYNLDPAHFYTCPG